MTASIAITLISFRTIQTISRLLMIILSIHTIYLLFYTSCFPINVMYVILLMKEIIVCLLIGLLAYLILSAVQIAGGFIDFQMGFAIANVVDPQTGAQSPLIGQYFYIRVY